MEVVLIEFARISRSRCFRLLRTDAHACPIFRKRARFAGESRLYPGRGSTSAARTIKRNASFDNLVRVCLSPALGINPSILCGVTGNRRETSAQKPRGLDNAIGETSGNDPEFLRVERLKDSSSSVSRGARPYNAEKTLT